MSLTDWPAKSPDLSPIEHVWAYLRTKTIGIVFANPDALFAFLGEEWSKIPSEMIE
jgi:transposase